MLDPAQTGGLVDVAVVPAWGGVNRGPMRDADWQQVAAVAEPLSLAPGVPVLAAEGTVAAGDYLRAFVSAPDVTARLPGGGEARIVSHIEPITIPVSVRHGETTTVDIQLVLRPLPAWDEPGWGAFVKSAAVRQYGAAEVTCQYQQLSAPY